ncbi:MAG: SDR family oxidoreductase [Armatimonadetes bacterium]|nr:SDR family oxidoreductase [Armatimonadota bacterium]
MDFGIENKVAMVAAGSKGIGLSVAKALAEQGCSVSICGRTEATLASAKTEVGARCHTHVADVAVAADLETWFDAVRSELGVPEILVTNTGGPPAGSIDSMTDEQWQTGVDSTLFNVIRMVRLALPEMKQMGWGRIVHITSLVATEPSLMLPISSTIRAGLVATTRIQAQEYGPFGITVNAVLPGHTLTDRQRHLAHLNSQKLGISMEEALANQGRQVPIGRLADPSEIAAPVAFLCSQQASYISGQSIAVDGGINRGI